LVIDQPLILTATLREAAARAASALNQCNAAEDLEAEAQRFAGDSEVKLITEEMQAMHSACLGGENELLLKSKFLVGEELWDADAALEMLRELGHAKVHRLQTLLSDARGGCLEQIHFWPQLGPEALNACTEAEDEVWKRRWPSDHVRRCRFVIEIEQLSLSDCKFQKRRTELEQELEKLALAAAAAT
jgi:hypothetical protein